MGPIVAEIYDALGEPERAAGLRWFEGDPRERVEVLEGDLEAAREQATELEDERDQLRSELEDERGRVATIAKIFEPIPALVDAVNNAIDALTVTYDDAIREVREAAAR